MKMNPFFQYPVRSAYVYIQYCRMSITHFSLFSTPLSTPPQTHKHNRTKTDDLRQKSLLITCSRLIHFLTRLQRNLRINLNIFHKMAQPQNRNNNAVDDDLLTATMAGLNVEDNPQLAMVKVAQERVDDGAQCTTCLETFNVNEDVAKLKCQHIFHRACIEPWLQRNKTCPICRTKIEWMDDIEVQMNHNIENGQAIINAVVARILDPAVDYVNARNRQVMEDKVARMCQWMDKLKNRTRRVMQHAMEHLNELNRQAMEYTGEQLRQTMDKVNELNGRRQAFVNAQQQMMIDFQEKANEEVDVIKLAHGIRNLIDDGKSFFELYWT